MNGSEQSHQNFIELTALMTYIGRESADVQFRYGLSLWSGKNGLIDFGAAAHCFKLSADQGNADGQWGYGECLRSGIGISRDLQSAVYYFKLSADQGNAYGQWYYGECLRYGIGISTDLKSASHYFKSGGERRKSKALISAPIHIFWRSTLMGAGAT
jgi:TPR repeat protein